MRENISPVKYNLFSLSDFSMDFYHWHFFYAWRMKCSYCLKFFIRSWRSVIFYFLNYLYYYIFNFFYSKKRKTSICINDTTFWPIICIFLIYSHFYSCISQLYTHIRSKIFFYKYKLSEMSYLVHHRSNYHIYLSIYYEKRI